MAELTERRAADRAKMADELERIATAAGATVTRPESYSSREIRLEIKVTGGARIHVDFDGDSCQPDTHVCTWNVELDSPACFGDFGSVNKYHRRKATRVCYGFDHLCETLQRDIAKLLSGEAYSAEHSRAHALEMIEREERAAEYYRPLVERGEGTFFSSGTPHESAEQVATRYAAIPARIAALQRFIAEGAEPLRFAA